MARRKAARSKRTGRFIKVGSYCRRPARRTIRGNKGMPF